MEFLLGSILCVLGGLGVGVFQTIAGLVVAVILGAGMLMWTVWECLKLGIVWATNRLLRGRLALRYGQKGLRTIEVLAGVLDDVNTEELLELIEQYANNFEVDLIRQSVEGWDLGRLIVRDAEDRHLYAVAKPSRAENLQRIRNVVEATSPQQRVKVAGHLRGIWRVGSCSHTN